VWDRQQGVAYGGRASFGVLAETSAGPVTIVMFFVQVSYLAILYAVARRCGLPYVSVIHQVVDDGSHMYGVELQLAQQLGQRSSQTTFFGQILLQTILHLMRQRPCRPL